MQCYQQGCGSDWVLPGSGTTYEKKTGTVEKQPGFGSNRIRITSYKLQLYCTAIMIGKQAFIILITLMRVDLAELLYTPILLNV